MTGNFAEADDALSICAREQSLISHANNNIYRQEVSRERMISAMNLLHRSALPAE